MPRARAVNAGLATVEEALTGVPVERPVRVTIDAASPVGEPVRVEADALEARIIQHELDHLDGVLTIDRTVPEARRRALGELRPQPVLG
jgi:peptide deformylase